MHDLASPTRSKTITWDDPAPALEVLGRIPGREYLQGMIDGRYPSAPIGRLIGFGAMSLGDGTCRVEVDIDESHTNPMGGVHGGVIAIILDTVLGCAVQTQLAPGEGHSSVTLETKFVRPATARSGRLIATGGVVSKGRTIATAEARVEDAAGKLIATGTSTIALFALPSKT